MKNLTISTLVFTLSAVSFCALGSNPALEKFTKPWKKTGFGMKEVKKRVIKGTRCLSKDLDCVAAILAPIFKQKNSYLLVSQEVLDRDNPELKSMFTAYEETEMPGLLLARVNAEGFLGLKSSRLRSRLSSSLLKSSTIWTMNYFGRNKVDYKKLLNVLNDKVIMGDPDREIFAAYLMYNQFLINVFHDQSSISVDKLSIEKEEVESKENELAYSNYLNEFAKSVISEKLRVKNKKQNIDQLMSAMTFKNITDLTLEPDPTGTIFPAKLGEIAYISLRDFMLPDLAEKIEEYLHQMTQDGATKIILDLRGNPGGRLYEANKLVDLFLESGKVASEVRWLPELSPKGKEKIDTHYTKREKIFSQPVVILIDNYSASASELVSQTLADYNRATVVGRTSFGKGTVQRTSEYNKFFGGKTGIKHVDISLTVARFFGPNGSSNHIHGVTPHINVERMNLPEGFEELRMSDIAYNPVSKSGTKPKYEASDELVECYKNGQADAIMENAKTEGDYQLYVGFDVALCL